MESRWRCGKMWSSHLPQLGCLPDAGGGPRFPRRQEEPLTKLVGHRETEGEGEVEAWQDQRPWGVAERGEECQCLEGPLGARIRGRACQAFSLPNQPGKSAQLSGWVLRPQKSLRLGWSWGHRREARREQERQVGRAIQNWRSRRGAEGVCPAHLSPGSLLGSQVGALPSETRGRRHA